MRTGEILDSTLDDNVADGGGAIDVGGATGYTAGIVQTTTSTNTGTRDLGTVQAPGDVEFQNGTIAFNLSGSVFPAEPCGKPFVATRPVSGARA